MIFGAGVLGGQVVDLLLRSRNRYEVTIASRHEDRLTARRNLAELVAINLGYLPRVSQVAVDLNNIEHTAEVLAEAQPDVIFNAATLQTFWLISALPKALYERLDQARVGPWLPMHLVLALKLMRAVRESGVRARVVNGAYPDAVNTVLARLDLAPDVGVGNVANVVPALRKGAALQLKCSLERIDIRLYAHHFFSNCAASTGTDGGAPFLLKVLKDGLDVSHEIDTRALLQLLVTDLRRTRGVRGQVMAASSAIRILEAIATDSNEILHAPGPRGLPGGYAVRVNSCGAEVVLPPEVSLREVISVNEAGQQFDGIDRIDSDGRVRFCEREMAVMQEVLGYHCTDMSATEAEGRADELGRKYGELARRVGVPWGPEATLQAMLVGRQ